MPTRTDPYQPPDPERFEKVLAMRAELQPDSEIVKTLALECGVHQNTIRADLRRIDAMFAERDEKKREQRRAIVAFQMACAAKEVLAEARNAEDPKARAINWKTLFADYFGKMISMYGLSDEIQAKTDLARQKLLEKLPPAEIDALIKAEVDKVIKDMPVEELKAIVAAREAA